MTTIFTFAATFIGCIFIIAVGMIPVAILFKLVLWTIGESKNK